MLSQFIRHKQITAQERDQRDKLDFNYNVNRCSDFPSVWFPPKSLFVALETSPPSQVKNVVYLMYVHGNQQYCAGIQVKLKSVTQHILCV